MPLALSTSFMKPTKKKVEELKPKRWIVRLSLEEHYRLKTYCAENELSQQELGELLLNEELKYGRPERNT